MSSGRSVSVRSRRTSARRAAEKSRAAPRAVPAPTCKDALAGAVVPGWPRILPSWLRIDTLTELKALIWESILTAVLVLWVTQLVHRLREPTPALLILPGAMLVIAASLFIMRRGAAREGG